MITDKTTPSYERKYLREVSSHLTWHYILIAVCLICAVIPLRRGFDSSDSTLIQLMSIIIISLYWLFQFRIVNSAVFLAKRERIDNSQLANLSRTKKFVLGDVLVVLRHHQLFIFTASLSLLGLSLALMGFLYFQASFESERGILQYVGLISIASNWDKQLPLLPHPYHIMLAGSMLLLLTITNSLISATLGLLIGHLRNAMIIRFVLIFIASCVFGGLYTIRKLTPDSCNTSQTFLYTCDQMLFRNRTIDSLQALSLTFVDGGTSVVTGLYYLAEIRSVGTYQYYHEQLPLIEIDREFHWDQGYQWRHLAVICSALVSQRIVSAFLLWRSRHS
jgi:hypothetical protein